MQVKNYASLKTKKYFKTKAASSTLFCSSEDGREWGIIRKHNIRHPLNLNYTNIFEGWRKWQGETEYAVEDERTMGNRGTRAVSSLGDIG